MAEPRVKAQLCLTEYHRGLESRVKRPVGGRSIAFVGAAPQALASFGQRKS